MNRRQKIIISVTGIFLVLLILIGLTYAYFLTQITGNTNEKSISVTTANLFVEYEDGDNIILDETTKLKPSNTPIGTKTFEVVNKGDGTDYVVVIDNVSITDATGASTTFNSNDFVYTLSCKNMSNSSECNNVNKQTKLPLHNNAILIGNYIKSKETQEYTITLWYLDNGIDQSSDMNKTLSARINISTISSNNPFTNKDSLAYHIVNNSIINKNGTQLMNTPPTTIALEPSSSNWDNGTIGYTYVSMQLGDIVYYGNDEELSTCTIEGCPDATSYVTCTDDVIGKYVRSSAFVTEGPVIACENGIPAIGTTKYENVLSVTEDDEGTSYYYRGNVKDNYVNFADMCWRVVRIEGDGATKLILEDQYALCNTSKYTGNWKIEGNGVISNYGTTNNIADYNNGLKQKLTTWFNYKDSNNILRFSDAIKEKIKKKTRWCLGDISNTYSTTSPYPILITTKQENITNNTPFYYEAGKRLLGIDKTSSSTLLCNNNNYSYVEDYIGAITADEAVHAGLSINDSAQNIYLSNGYTKYNETIQYTLTLSSYTQSLIFPGSTEQQLFVYNDYYSGVDIMETSINDPAPFYSARPSISLISGIEINSGDGTQTDPYVIKMN